MDSGTVQGGEKTMANANRRFGSHTQSSKSILELAAALLLVSLGVMFQLGELGYSHLGAGNLWFATMVAQGAWNVIAAHFEVPVVRQLLRFWPLILVCVGMGVLLVTRRGNTMRLSKVSADRRGSTYGM
jgi:hypothetical protein